jgi:hypothetical protein
MSLRINNNILNQKGTPAFFSDVYSNRPAAGFAGRVFISTDTGQIFEDTGSAWTLIADAGVGGGTLASVTANGNTTATGIVITANGLSTNSLTDTSKTAGSVLFSGTAGLVSQDNANLFWDDTNNRLGIGTNSPTATFDIHGAGTLVQLNGLTTNNAYLAYQNNNLTKWSLGNNYNAGANSFDLYNNNIGAVAFSVVNTTNQFILNENLTIRNQRTIYPTTNYSIIACDAGGFFFNNGAIYNAYLNFSGLTTSRSFTFPNTDGTLATTANLSSYLPLSGGTLTGALNGTTLAFNKFSVTNAANGQVVMGTSAGSANSINFSQNYSNGQPGWEVYGSTTNLIFEFNGNTKALYLGNLGTGLVYSNGGILTSTNPSDNRLKENIEVLKYGLKDILKLRPVTYNWKKDVANQGIQFGFIAQEVQEVMPEAIKEFGTDIKYLGLEKDAIYAALINAIKELNDKIDNLKN